MNRYLTIHIPEAAVPMPISRFLRTQAGLTKKADQPGKVPSRWYPEKRTAVPGNGNSLSRGIRSQYAWKRTMWILPSWNLRLSLSIQTVTNPVSIILQT